MSFHYNMLTSGLGKIKNNHSMDALPHIYKTIVIIINITEYYLHVYSLFNLTYRDHFLALNPSPVGSIQLPSKTLLLLDSWIDDRLRWLVLFYLVNRSHKRLFKTLNTTILLFLIIFRDDADLRSCELMRSFLTSDVTNVL